MTVYGIFIMNSKGEEKNLIAYNECDGAIRMPGCCNSNLIAHVRYSQSFSFPGIFLMNSDGTNVDRLTFNNADDYFPKLSNDRIAFTSITRVVNLECSIWSMNLDGSDLKRLTDTQAYGCGWSPDGKYIAYTDARAENGRCGL